MALLHEAVEVKKLDTRIIDRSLAKGHVTKEEVQKSFKDLPDDAANAEWISIDNIAAQEDTSPRPATRTYAEVKPFVADDYEA
jgi:hypothetical protein